MFIDLTFLLSVRRTISRTRHRRRLLDVTGNPAMPRRFKLLQLIVFLTGVLMLLLNLKHPIESVIPDQPDILPFRINVREIQGEIVWPIPDVTVGLPISHIWDLGESKTLVPLVIIVSTAPVRWERRDAIRQTWWKHCNASKQVSVEKFSLVLHHQGTVGECTPQRINGQSGQQNIEYL